MEIKNAEITDVTVRLNGRKSLTICLELIDEDKRGGCFYQLNSDENGDMKMLESLMSYLNCIGGDINELEGKKIRVIYKYNRLFAIGHPTKDRFLRHHLCYKEFSLSEIRKQFDAN